MSQLKFVSKVVKVIVERQYGDKWNPESPFFLADAEVRQVEIEKVIQVGQYGEKRKLKKCKFGSRCNKSSCGFKHSRKTTLEKSSVPGRIFRKEKMCKNRSDGCKYGENCSYAHTFDELYFSKDEYDD